MLHQLISDSERENQHYLASFWGSIYDEYQVDIT